MGPKTEIKTVGDAMRPHVIVRWGSTGPSDGPADGAAITCEALQITCPIILGFKSSGDIALALERGEVDALYLSDSSGANYVQTGQARAIASMARATVHPLSRRAFYLRTSEAHARTGMVARFSRRSE